MGIFVKLKEGIADLSELQVQTITGTLKTTIQSEDGDNKNVLNWQKLIQGAKSETEGEISLAAASNIKFDGDTDSFISDDATDRTLSAHAGAVNGALKVREGLVSAFSGLLGLRGAGSSD